MGAARPSPELGPCGRTRAARCGERRVGAFRLVTSSLIAETAGVIDGTRDDGDDRRVERTECPVQTAHTTHTNTQGGQERVEGGPDGSVDPPQVEQEEGNGRNKRGRGNRIDVTRELVLASSPSGSGCPAGHDTNPEEPSSQGRGGVTMIARETRQTRKRGVEGRQDQECKGRSRRSRRV